MAKPKPNRARFTAEEVREAIVLGEQEGSRLFDKDEDDSAYVSTAPPFSLDALETRVDFLAKCLDEMPDVKMAKQGVGQKMYPCESV